MKKLASILAVAFTLAMAADAAAQGANGYVTYGPRIGSYNYYVGGSGEGIVAQMYPAPRPTPPFVGHTYITYEPFAPHNFLYRHGRVYRRSHGYGNRTRTTVIWW